jgi:hypothetical protein
MAISRKYCGVRVGTLNKSLIVYQFLVLYEFLPAITMSEFFQIYQHTQTHGLYNE